MERSYKPTSRKVPRVRIPHPPPMLMPQLKLELLLRHLPRTAKLHKSATQLYGFVVRTSTEKESTHDRKTRTGKQSPDYRGKKQADQKRQQMDCPFSEWL